MVAALVTCCLLIACTCTVGSRHCDRSCHMLLEQSIRYVRAAESTAPSPGTYFEYNVTAHSVFHFTNGTYYDVPPDEPVSMRVRIECIGREATRALYRITYASDNNGSVLYLPHDPLNLGSGNNNSTSNGGIYHLPQTPINVTIWEDNSFELQCRDGLALRGLFPLFWNLDWGYHEVIVEDSGNRTVLGSKRHITPPILANKIPSMGYQEILLVRAHGLSYLGENKSLLYYEFDADTGLLLAVAGEPCSYMLLVPAGIDWISGSIDLVDTNFDLGPPAATGLRPADIQVLLVVSAMAIFFGGGLVAQMRKRSRARRPVEGPKRGPGGKRKATKSTLALQRGGRRP